jgi:hypothetical protein
MGRCRGEITFSKDTCRSLTGTLHCLKSRMTQANVIQPTAALVEKDFELYKPSMERMIDDWREAKARFMQEQSMTKKGSQK